MNKIACWRQELHEDGHYLVLATESYETQATNQLPWTPEGDRAAAYEFICKKAGSKQTERRYSREIYRFYLWMAHSDIKGLKWILPKQIEAYLMFCASPPADWCSGPGSNVKLTSPEWRPFKLSNKPSVNTIQNTLAILKSFFKYLSDVSYIRGNPTRDISGKFRGNVMAAEAAKSHLGNTDYFCKPGKEPQGLSIQQWEFLLETIEELPRKTLTQEMKYERSRYIIRLLYYTAMRSEEARTHTQRSMELDPIRNCWKITIYGKGSKKRVLPLHVNLIEAIKRFRKFHGLTELPFNNEPLPLFPHFNIWKTDFDKTHKSEQMACKKLKSGLSESSAEEWIKSIFRAAYRRAEKMCPAVTLHDYSVFKTATLHTIRHTRARHMLFHENTDIRIVQAYLGHSKILTTQSYTEPTIDELLLAGQYS